MISLNSIKQHARQSVCLMLAVSLCLLSLSGLLSLATTPSHAQTEDNQNGESPLVMPPAGQAYIQTNFVSDVPGFASLYDPLLVNPWGIALTSTSPFWVANNVTSTSTLYRGDVGGSPLVANPGLKSINITGSFPTGAVANTTSDFVATSGGVSAPARFIFASLTGKITAWSPSFPPPNQTTAGIVNGIPGNVYTGLAIGNNGSANFLYAADFAHARIVVFDKNFVVTTLAGNFTDPTLPADYSPFNIQNLGNTLYVAYAKVDPVTGEDEEGIGNGFVSKFDLNGNFLGRVVSNGPLNSPWGLVIAPASFGNFGGDLLVGNFGEGGPSINAFNPMNGAFIGSLQDEAGNDIEIDELWALTFGNGGNGGDTGTLYFSAGPSEEEHGLFGSLKPTTTVTQTLVQFSASDYGVGENDGQISITVIRTGDTSGASTVNYAALTESQPGHAAQNSVLKEGTPLIPLDPLSPPQTQSYERKPGGASGSTQDTGNNAADFLVRMTSDPQNLSSSPTPATNVTPGVSPIVISEWKPFGPIGPRDQFVELYNNSNNSVDVSGYKLKSSFSFKPVTTNLTINAGTVIPPRGHFLAVCDQYSGSVSGNQTYTQVIDPTGGIAITLPDDTIVDQVGVLGGDFILMPGTLSFSPGETSKTFQVAILADSLVEGDETIKLVLSNSTGAGLVVPREAELTIFDATGTTPAPPSISINDVTVQEGNSGFTNATFTVGLNTPSAVTTTVNFATANGTATSPSDFNARSGTLNFAPGEMSKTVTVQVQGDTVIETDETFFVNLSNPSNATLADSQGSGTIQDDDTPSVQLDAPTYSVAEGAGRFTITITRSSAPNAGTVDFATSDNAGLSNCNVFNGNASQRCDYEIMVGTLRFDIGQSSKTITIPVIDDVYADGNENFTLTLSNPSGLKLGANSTATLTITDNDSNSSAPNPIDQTAFFLRQHYLDFLGREPDPPGLQGWTNILNGCPQGSTACDRIEVSSAFFRSNEFQTRGYFIYRFYSASLGRIPHYSEFIPDLARISGFLTPAELEANKVAFVNEFMARPEFQSRYGALTDPTAFVDALLQTAGLPNHPTRSSWIMSLTNGTLTRAQVLRALIESSEVSQKFFNEGFVVELYFGYLRRDADMAYLSWLQTLNQTGNVRTLVNGFLNSLEYRARFGQP